MYCRRFPAGWKGSCRQLEVGWGGSHRQLPMRFNILGVHLILTRLEVNNGTLLQQFCQKLNCLELPLSLQKSFVNLGLNLTGTILMRLRTYMQNLGMPAPQPSLLQCNNLNLSEQSKLSFDSSSITCFTDDSVFHPKYSCPFWVADEPYLIYPTVNHYVYVEAANYPNLNRCRDTFDNDFYFEIFLLKANPDCSSIAITCSFSSKDFIHCVGFPNTFIDSLMRLPADEVSKTFHAELHRRYPDPVKYHNWQNQVFLQSLLKGCRAKFQLHSDLLRCILDTGDSLLVYCHRYTTSTCEMSVGMREFELREWMRHSGLTSMDLMTYMTIDPCHRPPFLGANRLGRILMSLRKEFETKTITLFSELTSRPDIVFGEYSGLETGDDFDSNTTDPSMLLWPNPYVSMIKMQNKRLWYPKKRRLSGYYANGQEIESKKRNLHALYTPHPEYAFDVIRNFPIPPDIIEHNADKPYVLVDMICRLSQDAAKYTETIKQQENDLRLLLEELYERNDIELKYGPIIKYEKNSDQNGEHSLKDSSTSSPKPDKKIAEPELFDDVGTENKTFDLESKLALIKLSFEKYFLRKLLGSVEEDRLFRSVFDSNNSPKFDETKIKAIIDRLYRHLNEQQKIGALDWLTHAVYRMRQLHAAASRNEERPSPDVVDKISTLDVQQRHKFFVAKTPSMRDKVKITISHSLLLEKDDLQNA
uniref:Uncharacterized protein n=1 Tax=Romanomermis culicivorax TaxID=13658 RepID=A0A915JF94_ROMCU